MEVSLHCYYKILGSKGLSPHELAHKWVKDLRTRANMSKKREDYPTICEYRVESKLGCP